MNNVCENEAEAVRCAEVEPNEDGPAVERVQMRQCERLDPQWQTDRLVVYRPRKN